MKDYDYPSLFVFLFAALIILMVGMKAGISMEEEVSQKKAIEAGAAYYSVNRTNGEVSLVYNKTGCE